MFNHPDYPFFRTCQFQMFNMFNEISRHQHLVSVGYLYQFASFCIYWFYIFPYFPRMSWPRWLDLRSTRSSMTWTKSNPPSWWWVLVSSVSSGQLVRVRRVRRGRRGRGGSGNWGLGAFLRWKDGKVWDGNIWKWSIKNLRWYLRGDVWRDVWRHHWSNGSVSFWLYIACIRNVPSFPCGVGISCCCLCLAKLSNNWYINSHWACGTVTESRSYNMIYHLTKVPNDFWTLPFWAHFWPIPNGHLWPIIFGWVLRSLNPFAIVAGPTNQPKHNSIFMVLHGFTIYIIYIDSFRLKDWQRFRFLGGRASISRNTKWLWPFIYFWHISGTWHHQAPSHRIWAPVGGRHVPLTLRAKRWRRGAGLGHAHALWKPHGWHLPSCCASGCHGGMNSWKMLEHVGTV